MNKRELGLLLVIIIGIILVICIISNNTNTTKDNYTYIPIQTEQKIQEYGHAYFLCGWKNCDTNYRSELNTLKKNLGKLYPDIIFTVEQFSWRCGDRSVENASLGDMKSFYLQADAYATEDAQGLAQTIRNLPSEERKNTVLFGHSLGAKVVLKAMAILSKENIRIRRAVLFGAAISVSDDDIDLALRISNDSVLSLIHPQDGALMIAAYTMGTPQLGLGSCYERGNLEEILIDNYEAGSVLDIASSEFRKKYQNNHSFSLFLSKWNELCKSNFTYRINTVIIPQDQPNICSTVIDAELWWSRKDEFYDNAHNHWKLQQHSITGHCRIVQVSNSGTYRRATGSYQYMKPSFDRVRHQIAL